MGRFLECMHEWSSTRDNRIRTSVLLLSLAALTMAVILAGCGSDDDVSTDPGTSAALEVVAISPADEAINVSCLTDIVVTFNRSVDPATVTASSFQVTGLTGDIVVDGAVVTYMPLAILTPDAGYTVAIATDITDTEGVALGQAFLSTFTAIASTGEPVADAGGDTDVYMRATVALDGTGSVELDDLELAYAWTQVGGPSVGDLAAVASPTFTAPAIPGALLFELVVSSPGGISAPDEVTVFVCRNPNEGFYVAADGNDTHNGSRATPFATIQRALDISLDGVWGVDVYVTEGTYAESLTLRYNDVGVYGGFSMDTWERDPEIHVTLIEGGATTIAGTGVKQVILDGFQATSADAVGFGASSTVLRLVDCDQIILSTLDLMAGDGFAGTVPDRPDQPAQSPDGGEG